MKSRNGLIPRFFFVAFFVSIVLVTGPAAVSADVFPGALATVTAHPDRLEFEPKTAGSGLTLTVSGANGANYNATYAPGDAPSFELVDNEGNPFPDGEATYVLRVNPVVDANAGEDAKALPADAIQTGGFTIVDGAIVFPAGSGAGPVGDSDPGGPALEAQAIADDLIVYGSLCVGMDCVINETFGFDTLLLKENNVRIKFNDTSNSASFPSNDWQITINDTDNGGADRFSIDDVSGGKTPFTIEAGAPRHALYVDNNGQVGLGTSTPALKVHVVDDDTPTVRLEQDGLAGFTPQTWDVAGNETNFFVRDTTNGSKLPFRIFPGAPSSSLHIAADGKVGMGTSSPGGYLHVRFNESVDPRGLTLENTGGDFLALRMTNNVGNVDINATAAGATPDTLEWRIDIDDGDAQELTLNASGDLTVTGNFISRATMLNVPDYVFEPDYALMPLTDLASYIHREKHLPNVPSAREIKEKGGVDMSQLQMKLLEKVEELTLYTLELQESLQLQARLHADAIARFEARLAEMEKSGEE